MLKNIWTRKSNAIFDWVVIIINLTYATSIIGNITLDKIPIQYSEIRLLLPMMICFHCRFRLNFQFWKCYGGKSILLKCWFFYLAFEGIQGMLMSNLQGLGIFLLLIYYFYLSEYIYNSFVYNRSLTNKLFEFSKPYCIYCGYNLVVVCLCALLIGFEIVSATDNDITDKFAIFASNHIYKGDMYYFPGFISVAESTYRLLAPLNIPVLDGLSYEPNCLCFSIIPAFFILLSLFYSNKVKTVSTYVLLIATVIISTSTTAILCLLTCLLAEGIWKTVYVRNYSYLISVVLIFVAIYVFFQTMYSEIFMYLSEKTLSGDASRQYSEAALKYIISPTRIFGLGILKGNLDGSDLLHHNIGYVSSFGLLLLYFSTIVKSLIFVKSKDINLHYIGLSSLYFWLHTLKLGVRVFNFPLFSFMLIILGVGEILFKNADSKTI